MRWTGGRIKMEVSEILCMLRDMRTQFSENLWAFCKIAHYFPFFFFPSFFFLFPSFPFPFLLPVNGAPGRRPCAAAAAMRRVDGVRARIGRSRVAAMRGARARLGRCSFAKSERDHPAK